MTTDEIDRDSDRDRYPRRGPGRIWAGLFLLVIGGVLLLDQMGFPLPDWLFNWHVLLIAIGIFIGLRHRFRGAGWLIMIAIGGVYLAQDYYHDFNIHRFIWPGVLILIGLMFILRPNRNRYGQEWREQWDRRWDRRHWDRRGRWGEGRRWGGPFPDADAASTGFTRDPSGGFNSGSSGSTSGSGGPTSSFGGPASGSGGSSTAFSGSTRESYSSDDYIDATSIFGGVHKKVVSKSFKGGDVTTVLGGTEIDLTQADFTGTIRLEITQIMGGTKIIVPPHWEVRSEVTAVFAGFEDKRQQPAMTNPEKVLIINGTSFLGGIELKNY